MKIKQKYSLLNLQVEREAEQNVLSLRVDLTDGTKGYIFSRNPQRNESRMFTYNCHICSVPNLPGERCLYTHMSGRRHQTKLTSKQFDASLFRQPLQRTNKSTFYVVCFDWISTKFAFSLNVTLVHIEQICTSFLKFSFVK